jgi:hypothetical protein
MKRTIDLRQESFPPNSAGAESRLAGRKDHTCRRLRGLCRATNTIVLTADGADIADLSYAYDAAERLESITSRVENSGR